MINLNFYYYSTIFFFIYLYIEIFYSILFVSVFNNKKNNILNFSKKFNINLDKNNIFNFCIYLILLSLVFLKIQNVQNIIISTIFIYICLSLILSNVFRSNNSFLNFNVSFFLFLFHFIHNLISFFLFLELYSIIFFFFFLNTNKNESINFLQYKNMLLMYLFNNFFSTILFLIGIYFVTDLYGTINFYELNFLNSNSFWQIYFIIISFMLKLSLPGLHFLKIEIYKYLSLDVVIIYSVITLFLNYIFLTFLFSQNFILIALNYYKIINILIILGLVITIQKLKINSFQEFIAYSGFTTNTLIILNFLT